MSRREARTLAMKSLFSLDFTTDVSPLDTVKALLEDEDTPALPKDDENYAAALVTGTREHLEAIDSVLDTLSDEWKVKRMAGVDRNLLRMAAFEMYFSPQRLLLPLPSVRRWRLPKSMAEMTLPISSMASWGH